ncbi:MAG TPA: NUDIX domain-containing protein [Mycobacteriales bacterium]|nr:NUDIX domain-containing protein [Mycobacteriales bacterium]
MVRLGVNVVIRDERGRVLLARRDRPPIWNLPGGGVEPNEAPWDAAIRETREEVGLQVRIDRLTGVYDRSPDGDPVLVFRALITGGELTTTAESTELGWFDPAALPEPINPYQRLRITDGVRDEQAAALRDQPGPSVRVLYPDL